MGKEGLNTGSTALLVGLQLGRRVTFSFAYLIRSLTGTRNNDTPVFRRFDESSRLLVHNKEGGHLLCGLIAKETKASREEKEMRATGGADETTAGRGSTEMSTVGEMEEQRLVDRADLEDSPECPICNEAFDPQRPATPLGCGHSLCSICLEAIKRKNELPCCPFCRRTFKVGPDHQAAPITIAGPEQRVQYSSLLHKLLGCCVNPSPETVKVLRVLLLLMFLCLFHVIVVFVVAKFF